MKFGVWEIVLIILLVLILFGGSKLAGVGKSLGKSIKEFKAEVKDDNQVVAEVVEEPCRPETVPEKDTV